MRAASAAVALLSAFVILGIDGARRDTPTVDEFAHLPAGLAMLRQGVFDIYPHNPPLARLWMAVPVSLWGVTMPPAPAHTGSDWLPWIYGLDFLNANKERYLDAFFRARLAVVGLSVAGGLLVFLWARRLAGETPGLVALGLYVGCPHVQAHGRLATVDGAFTTLLLATFVALDHFRRQPSIARLILAGLAVGLATLTKFTALLMLPVLLALLVGIGLVAQPAGRAIAVAGSRFAALVAVAVVVVNAGYAFRGTFASVGAYRFESALGQRVARTLPVALPLPLPRDFVTGLDRQMLDTERGEFGAYFAGRWYPRSPLLATLALLPLRLPLVTLGLLGWAALRSTRKPGPWLDEAFVWLPPLALVGAFAAGNALNPALRYLLPALPFFHIAIARSLAHLGRRALWATAAVLSLLTLATHPHQLAFFNALAGGRDGGHRWFIDSNLDWGQDLYRVRPWMQAHGLGAVSLLYFGHVEPELYGISYALPPSTPRPGTYVVSVNFAKGYSYVAPDHGRVVAARQGAPAWLRALTPVDRIGDSLWVYRVP